MNLGRLSNQGNQGNQGNPLSQNSTNSVLLSNHSGHQPAGHPVPHSARSMLASSRKRLQVRNENATPLAEPKHVGLPKHLWASTEIETMPPKQDEPARDVFEEWTFDEEDGDILGKETDVLAPKLTKRNSLDLDWDEVEGELEEVKGTKEKAGHVTRGPGNGFGHVRGSGNGFGHVNRTGHVTGSGLNQTGHVTKSSGHVTQGQSQNHAGPNSASLFKPQSRGLGQGHVSTPTNHVTLSKPGFSGFPGNAHKPIAKPFSRRPARAIVPAKSNKSNQGKDKENEFTIAKLAPVRTSTPSKIPVRKSLTATPVRSSGTPSKTTITPARSTHNFMNPTKSAEAKMRVKVESRTPKTPNTGHVTGSHVTGSHVTGSSTGHVTRTPLGTPSRSQSRLESRMSSRLGRAVSRDTLRPSTADSADPGDSETRPNTAGSNWSNVSDLDRFSFEEEFNDEQDHERSE